MTENIIACECGRGNAAEITEGGTTYVIACDTCQDKSEESQCMIVRHGGICGTCSPR